MSFKNVGWQSNESFYVHDTPSLTPPERETLRQKFVGWVQQDYNFLDPADRLNLDPGRDRKKVKKIRKELAKAIREGTVFPNSIFIGKEVNLPRGGAVTAHEAVALDLTRDQVLFWLQTSRSRWSMVAKLGRFRNPEDVTLVKGFPEALDVEDLVFFAELSDRHERLGSGDEFFRHYREWVQGARDRPRAVRNFDKLTASQLHFWFDGMSHQAAERYGRSFKRRVENRLNLLEHGAKSASNALETVEELNADHLAYWAAETGAAVFEIHLLVRTGAADDLKRATEMVYFDRMYRTGPGAEERIRDRDSQEVWEEALTPTRINATEWSTWGDDVLRLVCKHHPVEDNRFYPLGLLLSMSGNVEKEHEPAILHAFETLVGLCTQDPRLGWIGGIVATKPRAWITTLLNWEEPPLPTYTP